MNPVAFGEARVVVARWHAVFPRVPVGMALAIMHVESRYKPAMQDHSERAEKRGGAYGLMGMTAATAAGLYGALRKRAWVGTIAPLVEHSLADYQTRGAPALLNPDVNAMFSFFYLDKLVGLFHDVDLAMAAYHAGEGRVAYLLKKGLPVVPNLGEKDQEYYALVTEARQRIEKGLT